MEEENGGKERQSNLAGHLRLLHLTILQRSHGSHPLPSPLTPTPLHPITIQWRVS